ncbi:MAG: phenylalanine 4-monooxygenase [Sphingobacteriales bacterium 41-5]|nr:MAG: phenylalanine 4-monooxygenase [Sphingobacteriales bacterium 41-5]
MRQHFHSVRDFILLIIDFFYPPFKKLMPKQTFRYAVSGAGNTFLGLLAYYITYKFVLQGHDFHFGFYAFKAHIAALFVSFCITFVVGFFLMKYVVFDDSKMRGHVQMFRYLMVCLFNLVLNYFLLKVAVELWHIYPVFAQIGTTVVVIFFSYMAQRHFSFKKAAEPGYLEEDESQKIKNSGLPH